MLFNQRVQRLLRPFAPSKSRLAKIEPALNANDTLEAAQWISGQHWETRWTCRGLWKVTLSHRHEDPRLWTAQGTSMPITTCVLWLGALEHYVPQWNGEKHITIALSSILSQHIDSV